MILSFSELSAPKVSYSDRPVSVVNIVHTLNKSYFVDKTRLISTIIPFVTLFDNIKAIFET